MCDVAAVGNLLFRPLLRHPLRHPLRPITLRSALCSARELRRSSRLSTRAMQTSTVSHTPRENPSAAAAGASIHAGVRGDAFANKKLMHVEWKSGSPSSVLLVKRDSEDFISSFIQVATYLLNKGKTVFVEENVHAVIKSKVNGSSEKNVRVFRGELDDPVDLVITLGGDGTLLHAISLFQDRVPVFLSFRFGTLGFLTPHVWCPDTFTNFIDKAFKGPIPVQLRGRLNGQIWRCNPDHTNEQIFQRKILNEVTIHRGLGSRVDLDIYVNNNFVTTICGDGVLVSTPSGSTAHALSAGSSLVHPNVPCLMITPICVHSLSFRPIILPVDSVIKVIPAESSRFMPFASFDGCYQHEISDSAGKELIVIESSREDRVPCICSDEPVCDWLTDLQERLWWNVSNCSSVDSTKSRRSTVRRTTSLSESASNIRSSLLEPDHSEIGQSSCETDGGDSTTQPSLNYFITKLRPSDDPGGEIC